MSEEAEVAAHYTHGTLLESLRRGLEAAGKTPETVEFEDLGAVDEFHIGGRRASERFFDQLSLTTDSRVLDLGCGVGGPARFVASRFGCRVAGVDLTAEFVEAGQTLSSWVGLGEWVSLRQASALDLPFPDEAFDTAYMMHVGMNIRDKAALCAEVFRVLKPGGTFGVYDVMRTAEGRFAFPVPWAETEAVSFVEEPEVYRAGMIGAGLELDREENWRAFALDFFAAQARKSAAAGGPPPLGLQLLVGESFAGKIKNMVAGIAAGTIAPVVLSARKPV